MDYAGRVVLVTGASAGIGRVTARAFAERGAAVVAVARREALLVELMDECRSLQPAGADPTLSSYFAGDLGEKEFAQSVVDKAVASYGRLDVLVNNAAVPKHKLIYRISVEEAEATFRVNFLSCLWTTFAAIPYMLNQAGGHIVNVSSFASIVVPTHETIYAASKSAMNGFSEGLLGDLAGSGIGVSLIHPGPIATEIWGQLEEPGAYDGERYPPELVADGILECIEKKRFEMVVPQRNPKLSLARTMRFLAPSLVRSGVAKMDPIPLDGLERARARAREGKRLGED